MSMYGRMVSELGIHRNEPCTSWRLFSDELSITYTGVSTKTSRSVSTIRRVQWKDFGCAIGDGCSGVLNIRVAPLPLRDQQVDRRHEQQEQQQQHGHRRAGAEVPTHERRLVDVDRQQVGRVRW